MPTGPVPPEGGEDAAGAGGAPAAMPGAGGGALSVLMPPAILATAGREPGAPASGGPASREPVDKLAGLLRVLDALDPPSAETLRGLVPRADGTMGLSLALFQALIPGGLRRWAGSAFAELDLLDGGGAVDAADAGFAARQVQAGGASWSVRGVPLLAGEGRFDAVVWAVRTDRPAGRPGAVDFLVQLRLEEIGPVQIEGAVLPGGGRPRRLDMVLRTAGGLGAAAEAELCRAYDGLIGDHGLAGELRTAPLAGYWVELEDALHADRQV